MNTRLFGFLIFTLLPCVVMGQQPAASLSGSDSVSLIKMPYRGSRNVAELSPSPDYLALGGIEDVISKLGFTVDNIDTVELTLEEQKQ